MAQLRKRRRLFLEAVQKTMLTGASCYFISSHLKLMSSLCQRYGGAVNKGGGACAPHLSHNTKASIRIYSKL